MTTTSPATRSSKLLLAAFALSVAGCGVSDPLGVDGGRVQFVLSSIVDAPALNAAEGLALTEGNDGEHHRNPYFASANVTFTSILARDLSGVLVNVDMGEDALPVTLEVINMEGRRSVALPDGNLPAQTYDQVVVVMTQVEGVTHDGTTITIAPPGGGWTAIVPICPFVVEDGATTVVGLTLSVRRAFSWRDNRFHFDPRFECEHEEPDVS